MSRKSDLQALRKALPSSFTCPLPSQLVQQRGWCLVGREYWLSLSFFKQQHLGVQSAVPSEVILNPLTCPTP